MPPSCNPPSVYVPTLYGPILTPFDFDQRGIHEIKNELVFGSNPDFVFHDSCGFEAGGEAEFKQMKEFVLERASTTKLKERIHAIWYAIISEWRYLLVIFCCRYCIPMDECHRAITKAEEMFFAECDTSSGTCLIVISSTWWLMTDLRQFP